MKPIYLLISKQGEFGFPYKGFWLFEITTKDRLQSGLVAKKRKKVIPLNTQKRSFAKKILIDKYINY